MKKYLLALLIIGSSLSVFAQSDKGTITVIKKDKSEIFKKGLYILDGKAVSKKQFQKINPKSILSVKVLKGKAAITLYGKKGKNGVILITTKKD